MTTVVDTARREQAASADGPFLWPVAWSAVGRGGRSRAGGGDGQHWSGSCSEHRTGHSGQSLAAWASRLSSIPDERGSREARSEASAFNWVLEFLCFIFDETLQGLKAPPKPVVPIRPRPPSHSSRAPRRLRQRLRPVADHGLAQLRLRLDEADLRPAGGLRVREHSLQAGAHPLEHLAQLLRAR